MKNNHEKTFWSTEEDSDEDFEAIINASRKEDEVVEAPSSSKILSSEKMDFLWSDEEEEAFIGDSDFEGQEEENINEPIQENINEPKEEYINEPLDENINESKLENINESKLGNINESKLENINESKLENINESKLENIKGPLDENIKGPIEEYIKGPLDENIISKVEEEDSTSKEDEVITSKAEGEDSTGKEDENITGKEDEDSTSNEDENIKSKVEEEDLEEGGNFTIKEEYDSEDSTSKVEEDLIDPVPLKNFTHQEEYTALESQCKEEIQEDCDEIQVTVILDKTNKDEEDFFGDSEISETDHFFDKIPSHGENLNQPEIENEELVDKLQDYYTENIQEAEIIEKPSIYNQNIFDDKDSMVKNTGITELEDGIKNIKLEEVKIEEVNIRNEVKTEEVNVDNDNIKEFDFLNEEIEDEESTFFNNVNNKESDQEEENNPIQPIYNTDQREVKPLTIPKSQVEIPPVREPKPALLSQKGTVNLTSPRAIACLLKGSVVTYYSSIQKRYSKQGVTKEQSVNIVNTYKLDSPLLISKWGIPSNYEHSSLQSILDILDLKDIHSDSIVEAIGARPVNYASKPFSDSGNVSNINAALNLANINTEMAIDFALSKNMWAMALILSKMDKRVLDRVLSEMIDKDMKSLFLEEDFIMKRPWKDYFTHFANTKKSSLHDKYIQEIFKNNQEDGFLVLISLHLCKVINLSDYLEFFSHKNHFLYLLFHLHKNHQRIENLDLLMYEYILDIKDRNLDFAKDFYKNNKKEFRKDLQSKLDEFFKLNWNFGLKDVLNFGISKILDVHEPEHKINNEKNNFNYDEKDKSKDSYNEKDKDKKNSYNEKNSENIDNDKKNSENIDKDNILVKPKHLVNSKKPIYLNKKQNVINEDPKIVDPEIKGQNLKEETPPKIYTDQKHSKSFADFFDSDRNEKEATTEDDTSLFLSKYNLDDEDEKDKKEVIKDSSETEEKGSFFGIFNMFKKKSYKIDVKASDDIKYDPVTKRWVSGNQSEAPKEAPLNIPKIPTPQSKSTESPSMGCTKKNIDLKKMSLYAGKKKTTIGGFNTLKRDAK